MKKIILTTFELPTEARERLSQVSGATYDVFPSSRLSSKSDYSRVEIILVDTARANQLDVLKPDSLRRFSNLKLVQSIRAGLDVLDFEKIPASVVVCGNIRAYGDQIAEHIFGMMLYFARNLGVSNSALSKGIWEIKPLMFLKGKTILVVGAGGIGESVGRIASFFGMRTIGINTSGNPVPNFEQIVTLDKLHALLKEADVVVISMPLTVKTFHLFDKAEFNLMKLNCILVNVSRGHIICEHSLYEHLRSNPDFKCGLDVWWHYPKPGEKFAQRFPFFELPNFLGTPHDSGMVPETEEIAVLSAIGNIDKFIRNEPLKGVMNRNDYLGLKELIARAN